MEQYDRLINLLKQMGGVVIGYSGGVDSTLLAKAATDALGERALCVFVESVLMPKQDIDQARSLAEQFHFHLMRIAVDVFTIDGVSENPPDRCYFCKKGIFSNLVKVAKQHDLPYVLDGANVDDASDYRPGTRATKELEVRSPFKELGFTKQHIRQMSKQLGLPTWNKPSNACLASRVPYGISLTPEILKQIDAAENLLRELGFSQFRIRHHGDMARIELLPTEMQAMMDVAMRRKVVEGLQQIGYAYAALDLRGYRTGSMNEILSERTISTSGCTKPA